MNKKRFLTSLRTSLAGFRLSKLSFRIYFIGLSVILFYLVLFIFELFTMADTPKNVLSHIYFDTVEHIVMSATLIVLGALFIDLFEKSLEDKS